MKKVCKLLISVVALVMALGLSVGCATRGVSFTPGTYRGVGMGWIGPITVEVVFSNTEILSVEVIEHRESPGVSYPAIDIVPAQIVAYQTLAVDAVVGATVTRMGILGAVMDAVNQAGVNPAALMTAIPRRPGQPVYREVDVVIIGGGGAGLSAAVIALDQGESVLLLEKTSALGGNTLAGGNGITNWNAIMPEWLGRTTAIPGQVDTLRAFLDMNPADFAPGFREALVILQGQIRTYLAGDTSMQFDSKELHIVQTYVGSIRIDMDDNRVHSIYEFVRVMVDQSPEAAQWMQSIGGQFQPALHEPLGAMWRRALRPATNNHVDFILPMLARVNALGGEIMLNTRAGRLIVEDGVVRGVTGTMTDGTPVTVRAGSVVLATGGYSANRPMVARYNNFWPNFNPNIGTTNVLAAMGDGIIMAQEAGAGVVHMGIPQLIPNGFATTGALSLSAGGRNVVFVDHSGRRFVNERDERDTVSAAAFRIGGTFFEIKRQADEVGNQLRLVGDGTRRVFAADTLAELAVQIGVPPAVLEEEIARYNQFAAQAYDPDFGTSIFLNNITGPYMARYLAPSIHYTMGGLTTNLNAQVLHTNGNVIPNLFAAGEVMGGIHGGNRLGGNAVPEAMVFGRIAGMQATANAR